MKVACISDTHGRHGRITVPPCDLLVHAGDMTRRGSQEELEGFVRWFAEQPATARVFVAGNHDTCCEQDPAAVRSLAERYGVTYLCDEALELDGLRIWGSPMTPRFRNMAFNRERGPEIDKHWQAIPKDLDLLITHGPPKGLGDRLFIGTHAGCQDLLKRVQLAKPRFHLFGHIHENAGQYVLEGSPTRFFNVASSRLLPVGTRRPTVLYV